MLRYWLIEAPRAYTRGFLLFASARRKPRRSGIPFAIHPHPYRWGIPRRRVKRLITVPGISYFSGLLLASEIADINRFGNYKKICCYAGLSSTTRQSADKTHHGHIIKDSNKYIRYALIEAVSIAIRKDPALWAFYTRIHRKKGINKAKIAVAKKLLVSIYSMLKNNTDYRIGKINDFNQVISKAKLGA